jgi:hypothetical protein
VTGLTAYASAYQRDRVCEVQLYAGEKRPLVANFTGILGKVPAISTATWETNDTSLVVMSAAVITRNTTNITIAAQFRGRAAIRCTVSLDNGQQYVQQFAVNVLGQPQFASDSATTGPTSIQATASITPPDDGGDGVLDGGGA